MTGTISTPVIRQLPPVSGHLAFLAYGQYVIWEYARGSWALLTGPAGHPPARATAKVAGVLGFGPVRHPALKFPVQLTGLPAAWHLAAVHFHAEAGILAGRELDLAGAGSQSEPSISVGLSGPGSSCFFYPDGQSHRRIINGTKVVINRLESGTTFQVCAPHAHGLDVFVSAYGH